MKVRDTIMARRLTRSDIGNVFRRVHFDARDEYLLLESHNDDTVSFITFHIKDGEPEDIEDTGFFNGPWYEPCRRFSDEVIATIKGRYERFVAKRLAEIQADVEREQQLSESKRRQYGKPSSWSFAGSEPVDALPGAECIVWYDEEQYRYIVEIHGRSGLLTDGVHTTGYAPTFGMDWEDVAAIYGEDGLIRRLVKSLEGRE